MREKDGERGRERERGKERDALSLSMNMVIELTVPWHFLVI